MAHKFHKGRDKSLGITELIAIALGGMIGGGIFSILGVSVARIGNATPIAIFIGGILALLSAYSYVKLAVYYKDEGATYSFYKRTFPESHLSASMIGWFIVFGYISTLALYAFTFASYATSVIPTTDYNFVMKIIAGGILLFFAVVNLISVKGMGKLEDMIVYAKLIILLVISVLLAEKGNFSNISTIFDAGFSIKNILLISSITFVAYEGFQLAIHATKETEDPDRNIPRAIYSAIGIAIFIYVFLSIAAILAIPKADLIANKEYALAAGAGVIFGKAGLVTVIFGAILATSSAINGTIFGASRLAAVIADDGYFPGFLSARREKYIPKYAIPVMIIFAYLFVLTGKLVLILEFGSVTFLIVSFLMAYANFKICDKTKSSCIMSLIAMFTLAIACGFIFYYEFTTNLYGMFFIIAVYVLLALCAWVYSKIRERQKFYHVLTK